MIYSENSRLSNKLTSQIKAALWRKIKNRGINTPVATSDPIYDEFLQAVTLLELIYSTAGIYEFLLARIVRMALAAYFDFDSVSFLGRTAYETCAASANYSNVMIIRLDILVHIITSPGIVYSMIIPVIFL